MHLSETKPRGTAEPCALRGIAAMALGYLGDTEDIDDLKRLLKDETIITDMFLIKLYSERFRAVGQDFSEPISLSEIIEAALWVMEAKLRRR